MNLINDRTNFKYKCSQTTHFFVWPVGTRLAHISPTDCLINRCTLPLYCRRRTLFLTPKATGEGIQYHEAEEPQHGGGSEEKTGDETPPGGQGGGQKDLLCQLHRYLQAVSKCFFHPRTIHCMFTDFISQPCNFFSMAVR